MSFQAYDFGVRNGFHVYRVSGSKEELNKILTELADEGAEFEEFPEIEPIRKGQFTMLLKIKE